MKTMLLKENNNQVKACIYSDLYILNQLRVCRSRDRLSVVTQQYSSSVLVATLTGSIYVSLRLPKRLHCAHCYSNYAVYGAWFTHV